MIFQVNREKQALEVDEQLESIDLEELQDVLPSHQPRFIVYRYWLDLTNTESSHSVTVTGLPLRSANGFYYFYAELSFNGA